MGFRSPTVAKLALAGALGFAGLATCSVYFNDAVHPASKGSEYLEKKGYTNIRGGDFSFFNTCGKNFMARDYTANDKDGKSVEKTVCFGLFGPRFPLIGG